MENYQRNSNGEIRTCVRCGKIFQYFGIGRCYCPSCKKQDDEAFKRVKAYIYEHGTATVMEVAEKTGVPVRYIKLYLKDSRIEIPENSPIFIQCERCGVNIRSGRLCPSCASELTNEMRVEMDFNNEQVGEIPKKYSGGKMRFLDKNSD
ncbi:hypothetical protein [Anaerocolumna sp.]|uniref:hypothetical protein n=1 Tax=Anaerocolumna sp. TaxID=2041569 RepID=UPI0028B11CBB|nr:hypothetical protein [Anaerocolumna sp.]